MKLIHGGDWAGYRAEYGREPLDFSANVSPLGVPDGIKAAIAGALDTADRYPDPLCRALCGAIAEKEAVPASFCLCGNGAADLIFRFAAAKKPKRALILAPCFAEYETALCTVGCAVEAYPLREENDFHLDEGFLERIVPGVDVVFLCEPNNPTGVTSPRALLDGILARCEAVGAVLALDECFGSFLDDPAAHTMKRELAAHPNLLILKAFTKLYAMAGVRLGYCLCADGSLLDAMRAAGQPWAVSSLAQAAGVAALSEDGYVARVRELIAVERPYLIGALTDLGLRVIAGEANYLLFHSPVPLAQAMREKGILLRDCSNYRGLSSGWYRAAVRTHAENTQLIAAIREVQI
jgi:threonine-phosphate decarboxylase